MKTLIATLLAVLLTGCASTPFIDTSLSAKGQSSRVKFIIVHYTVSDLPTSIRGLTQTTVSSHYLLTDEADPKIYQLVDESRQANHAGVSTWKNHTLINGSSVGIEIVNKGFTEGPDGRIWYPFPQAQIDKLIVLLKQIQARHGVPAENVLGHSDIAPQRKQDPGPLFPWQQLAQHGLVLWPDAAKVAAAKTVFEQQLPDVAWFQKRLALHGYLTPQTGVFDEATKNVMVAFQMKYRPLNIDGAPDIETAALLDALTAAAAAAATPAPAPAPVAVPLPVVASEPAPAAAPAPKP